MRAQAQIAQESAPAAAGAQEMAAEAALVQSSARPGEDGPAAISKSVSRLPVEIDVAIPIREFRVRDLLALAPGQVIETPWMQSDDMPLGARGSQLAWTEFEVIERKLAVRITRLA